MAAAPMLELGGERAIFAAMLRVRSDTVDHLVNEAGEISVARSRIETELRNFRTSLLELTDSINRLRQQLREIEIQAESQMEARGKIRPAGIRPVYPFPGADALHGRKCARRADGATDIAEKSG